MGFTPPSEISDAKENAERTAAIAKTTLENMGQGIIMFDGQGNCLVHNSQLLECLGLSKDEMDACRTIEEFLRLGARNFDEEVVERSIHFARAGGYAAYESTTAAGRTLEVRQNPLADGGLVRTYTDITDRKRAEELLRFQFELQHQCWHACCLR